MKSWLKIAVFIAACCLSGCADLSVHLTASQLDNQNDQHQAQPIAVRVYFLSSSARFENATSAALFDQPSQALGDDLLRVEAFMLAPGTSIHWQHRWPKGTAYVGVAADYQDLWRLPWRVIRPVNLLSTYLGGNMRIHLGSDGLFVEGISQ